MGVKSTIGQRTPAGVVDRYIGTAYDTVKFVADNMDKINEINELIIYMQEYLGVHPEPPTHRTSGDVVEVGDYYYDTTRDAFGFITEVTVEEDPQGGDDIITVTAKYVDMEHLQTLADQVAEDAVEVEANALAASISETNAKASEDAAKVSENNSATNAANALASANNAEASALAAAQSADDAVDAINIDFTVYSGSSFIQPADGEYLYVDATGQGEVSIQLPFMDGTEQSKTIAIGDYNGTFNATDYVKIYNNNFTSVIDVVTTANKILYVKYIDSTVGWKIVGEDKESVYDEYVINIHQDVGPLSVNEGERWLLDASFLDSNVNLPNPNTFKDSQSMPISIGDYANVDGINNYIDIFDHNGVLVKRIDTANSYVTLQYLNATVGWKIIEDLNSGGGSVPVKNYQILAADGVPEVLPADLFDDGTDTVVVDVKGDTGLSTQLVTINTQQFNNFNEGSKIIISSVNCRFRFDGGFYNAIGYPIPTIIDDNAGSIMLTFAKLDNQDVMLVDLAGVLDPQTELRISTLETNLDTLTDDVGGIDARLVEIEENNVSVEIGDAMLNGYHFNERGWVALDEDFTFAPSDYQELYNRYFGTDSDFSQSIFTQSNITGTTTNILQSVSHLIDGDKRWFIFRAISGDVIMYEDYSNQFDIANANTPGDISNYSSSDYVAGTSKGFFTTTFSYSGNHNELCYIKFDTNAATAQAAAESMDRIATRTNFFSELMGNSFHFGDVNVSTVETSEYIFMYANENGTVAQTLSNIIYVKKSDVDANIDAYNDPFFDMSIYKYVNISSLIGSYSALVGNTARITVAFDNNGNMAACNWDASVSEPIVFVNVFSETMVNTVTNPTANKYTSLIPCYSIDGQVYFIANGYPSNGGTWIYDMSGNLITGTSNISNGCAYFAKGANPIIFGNSAAGFSPETAISYYKTGLDMDSATWTDIDLLITNKISSHEYAICNSGFSNSRWGRIATLNTCRMQREDLIQFCRSGSIGYVHSIDVENVIPSQVTIDRINALAGDKTYYMYVGADVNGNWIKPDGTYE